jgi:hypothetical protein
MRGASYLDNARYRRVAFRYRDLPVFGFRFSGFRFVIREKT